MTPRHPPRALRSLTTPIRSPPARERSTARKARVTFPSIRLTDGRRLATRSRPCWVTIPNAGRSLLSERVPRSVRVHCIVERLVVPLPLACGCLACVTDHRIVKEQRPNSASAGERTPLPCYRSDPPWPLARGRGRVRPRPSPSRRGQELKNPERAEAEKNPPRRKRVPFSVDRVWWSRADPRGEPAWGYG
jgi:hypothetical protein